MLHTTFVWSIFAFLYTWNIFKIYFYLGSQKLPLFINLWRQILKCGILGLYNLKFFLQMYIFLCVGANVVLWAYSWVCFCLVGLEDHIWWYGARNCTWVRRVQGLCPTISLTSESGHFYLCRAMKVHGSKCCLRVAFYLCFPLLPQPQSGHISII